MATANAFSVGLKDAVAEPNMMSRGNRDLLDDVDAADNRGARTSLLAAFHLGV